MRFIDDIFSFVWDISGYFYNAQSEVRSWPWPFWYLYAPLYELHLAFWRLLTPIAHLGDWIDSTTTRVASILSEAQILSILSSWLGDAEDAFNWIRDAWTNVYNIVNTWWSTTSQEVGVWVQDAKNYAQTLVNNVLSTVNSLQAAWDSFRGKIPTIDNIIYWWGNWTGNVLSTVNTWWSDALLEVQGLIDSAFVTREQFWAGWQDWRDKVAEFFTDPEDWLYRAVDRIIERFW